MPVRPRQAGIAAGWSWRTEDGRALMYTHGLSPDGYTKGCSGGSAGTAAARSR